MVPAFFRISLKRFLWLLGAYSATRVFFLLWNWPRYQEEPLSDLMLAFVHGLRFDTSAILFTNAPLLLLWLLPTQVWRSQILRVFERTLFALINFIFLGGNVIDAEFVNFIGKRTSFDIFSLSEDLERHSLNVILSYWPMGLGLLALIATVVWFYPRFPLSPARERWLSGTLWRLVALFLIFTGMRGGYQFRPLSPIHAYFSSKHELGLLALNTPFNVIKSIGKNKFERARYFPSRREVVQTLHEMTKPSRPPLGVAKDWNVVVLIVESLSTEYTGYNNPYPGFTPFFDELAKKSFYFHNNFANARRSLEGIPAVLCGLPAMMEEPILTSNFTGDRFDCMAKILRGVGYSTYFLHGTHNGSMHMDKFAGLAGFENFVGLDEYPKANSEEFDMDWGVLDEPMLQYAVSLIDQAKKPTFLSVFTLSSHHPYFIPEKYAGRFPKGSLEIHESIGYADHALRAFFKAAESKDWFNNTIFVITADHTHKNDPKNRDYSGRVGGYRVPLLIYAPGLEVTAVPYARDRVSQHVDIAPSVYDLLGLSLKERLLLGQSVFDLKLPGRAYNFTSSGYWYIESDLLVDLGKPPQPLRLYRQTNFVDRKSLSELDLQSRRAELETSTIRLKAVIQYMHDGLIDNNLYDWQKTLEF